MSSKAENKYCRNENQISVERTQKLCTSRQQNKKQKLTQASQARLADSKSIVSRVASCSISEIRTEKQPTWNIFDTSSHFSVVDFNSLHTQIGASAHHREAL